MQYTIECTVVNPNRRLWAVIICAHINHLPSLGEPANQDRLWLPCRLSVCYKRIVKELFPFPMETRNGHGCQLWIMLPLCHCPFSTSKWRHIKVHLVAYNHCLAECMFGAVSCPCHVNPFSMSIHNVRSVDWSERLLRRASCLQPIAPSTEDFLAVFNLYYSTVEIHFTYLGSKETYCISKTCCMISLSFSTKCHSFHNSLSLVFRYVFHKPCTKI